MWFSSSHNLPETEQEDKKGCPIMMAFLLHVEDVAEAADTSKTNTKQSSYFKWWYGGRSAKVMDKPCFVLQGCQVLLCVQTHMSQGVC